MTFVAPIDCLQSVHTALSNYSENYCGAVLLLVITLLVKGRACQVTGRISYQTIWSSPLTNVKWHSVTWPYIYNDNPVLIRLCTELDLLPYLRGFHRTSAMGVRCRHGTLTPPDTWSRPFGTGICSTCWDQSFFRTCRYFSGLCF